MADTLMSGLAVFGLKYPSLLQFDKEKNDKVIRNNLKTLYGIQQAPCDTRLREILDPVKPEYLHSVFPDILHQVQRGKALEHYTFIDDHYLISIDGTGEFSSNKISCPDCCQKNHRNGQTGYYHQLLGAVLVHPDQAVVLPLTPEPITRQDGTVKNDCERNAAKRLLSRLRTDHPRLKIIITEDGLSSNAPHIELIKSLNMHFILGAKPGDHTYLFNLMEEKADTNEVDTWQYTDTKGTLHCFYFANDLPLNESHPELLINVLHYIEIKENNKMQCFSWVTDFTLKEKTVFNIMKGGRARWKIENETFNTLKNQGYHLGHNYGHGKQHLSTIFSLLMMLAFLVDQVQLLCCPLFQKALKKRGTKISFWARIRAFFVSHYIANWEVLFEAIISGHIASDLQPDTS